MNYNKSMILVSVVSFLSGGVIMWSAPHLYRLAENFKTEKNNYAPPVTDVRVDSTNLPIVFIETGGQQIRKDGNITATMTIIDNGQGKLNYGDTVKHSHQHKDYSGYITIKYRGAGSFHWSPKKQYSIAALDKPMEQGGKKKRNAFLGMKKSKKWVLNGNNSDPSLIRNALVYDLARDVVAFSPQYKHCEVMVDGVYRGVYLFMEYPTLDRLGIKEKKKERRGKASCHFVVDLFNDYKLDEITPDYTSQYKPRLSNGEKIQADVRFEFKEPKRKDMSEAQYQYVCQSIHEMEKMLDEQHYSDDTAAFQKIIDVESFVNYQLVSELSGNGDCYRLSTFLYKGDGNTKLAIWDYDQSLGNVPGIPSFPLRQIRWWQDFNDYTYEEIRKKGNVKVITSPCVPFWWGRLMEDPIYVRMLEEHYKRYRDTLWQYDIIDAKVDSLVNVLTQYDAIERNNRAWNISQHTSGRIYIKDYNEEILLIKSFIRQRIDWLDEQFKSLVSDKNI